MSSTFNPAFAKAFIVLGTGPYPIISGSTPANANETNFALTPRPSSFALDSLARIAAVAPSFNPAAFPAVTFPSALNGVLSAASASIVVPGRGGSSTVATPQPSSAERTATGIKSR
ncbi:unannotated protein [freshwater metagenome]|uniref:Unannotated protein n=1 Tax=freshwater metagenome TaxID=449393 RepID=A0A6J6BQV3_9ZZZZ